MESSSNIREYSVAEISGAVKRTVEDAFGYVRVRGEISGFRGVHASGHCYFSLKDEGGKVRAVLFRSAAQRVPFELEEGIEILVYADVGVYERSGDLQLVEFTAILAVLIWIRHHENIGRLLKGQESRIGAKKS